jgi:U4/U6.U5 tri-snRNP-associated protein 1
MIHHQKEKINEGVDYIFTIRDKNVLDDSEGELDVLENQILKESKKSQKKKENLENEEKNDILSKYDEEKEDGFTIRISGEKEKILEYDQTILETEDNFEELNRIKEKFKLLKTKKPDVSENSFINKFKKVNQKKEIQLKFEKKFTADYMTHEEFKNKKPDFKKKKIPPRKGIQSIKTDDGEEENLEKNKSEFNNKPATQVYDEYDELNLFLEKQRNLTNKSKKIDPEDIVLKQILTTDISNSTEKQENNEKDNLATHITQPTSEIESNKNNLTEFISETTEFLKKIPSKSEIEENYKLITAPTPFSLKDAKSGTQSVVNIPLPNERLKFGVSSIINENDTLLNKKRESSHPLTINEDDTKSQISQSSKSETLDKEERVEELEEPLVGKGIATALKVLRRRGVIGKKELWGRFKDREYTSNEVFLPKKELEKFNENKIDLEYRDNKGRLLTPKEMFRNQCYIFHGKGPGKKKIEKRLLREQLEEKLKNQDPSESKTFKYLKSYQKKTNTPYLVLQGKNTSLP